MNSAPMPFPNPQPVTYPRWPVDFRNRRPDPVKPLTKTKPRKNRFDTLCIAAIARQKKPEQRPIVLCCDRQVQTEAAEGQIEVKIAPVKPPTWYALFAGDTSSAREVLARYENCLENVQIDKRNVQKVLQETAWSHRRNLIEHLIQTRFGVSYDEFRANGKRDLSSEEFRAARKDIAKIDFGCWNVFAGHIDNWPYLFWSDYSGKINREHHFVTLGTGAQNAQAMLLYRNQSRFDGLERTIYQVYEAKKFGEHAPGVGYVTLMFVLYPNRLMSIGSTSMGVFFPELEEQFGLRHIDSNDEVKMNIQKLLHPVGDFL